MELKKLLTILVVSTVVLAAMSTVIEAQRDGGHGSGGGGMGGGHHWSVNAGSDNNVGDDNNEGNNAGAIEVYVSTDKRRYVLGEPIEITVTAYNPTESTVTLEFRTSTRDFRGCQADYRIDDVYTEPSDCNTGGDNIPIAPRDSFTWTFIHTGDRFDYPYLVPVGEHSVIGIVGSYGQSRPITIQVVEPNSGR